MMNLKLYKKIAKDLESNYENFSYYLKKPTEDFKYVIEKENYLRDFDFDYLENFIGVKFRYYQKLAIYFSNYYLQNIDKLKKINTSGNQLAYWMATGSGKTIIMKADVINYLKYLKENGKIQSGTQIEIIITSSLSELVEQLGKEFHDFLIKVEKEFNLNLKITVDTIQSLMNKNEYKDELLSNQYRIVLADEAHIGLRSDNSRFNTFRKELVKNIKQSFMYEYSATFYNISSDLQEEYERKIVFEYNYDKFYNDFYGKDFKFGVIKADVLDEENEIKENIKQNLDDFEKKLEAYYAYKKFQDRPLLAVVGNKVIGKGSTKKEKEEADNELSDVEKFIDYLRKLKDISNYQKTFNTAKKTDLYVIYNKQDDELLLAFDEDKPFGLINVGNTTKLIQDIKEKKGVSYRESNFVKDEWKFANIDKKNSPINILIGSRKFSAGWNSFRVSQICLINFGVGEGNTIIQIFGRGVRLKGLRNDGKRQMNYVDENSFKTQFKEYSNDFILSRQEYDYLKYLETLYIYSLKSTYLKNFIENNTGIFKQKIVKDKLIKKKGKIKSIVIKNNYDFKNTAKVVIANDGKVHYEYKDKVGEFDIGLKVKLFVKDPKELVIEDYLWDYIDKVELEKYLLNKKYVIDLNVLKKLLKDKNVVVYYDSDLNVEKFETLLYKIINSLEKYIERKIEKLQKQYELEEIEYPYDKYEIEITFKKIMENIDTYKKILFEVIEMIKENIDDDCRLPEINTINLISKVTYEENKIDTSIFFKEIKNSYPEPIALHPEKNQKENKTLLEYIKEKDTHIEKISISPDALDEWELKFLNDLQEYVKKNNIENIQVLRNIPKKGSAIIGEEEDFYPDFIIEYKDNENGITHIVFCDPKGVRDASNYFKVCLAPYLIKEINIYKDYQFHSFVITHTNKKDIKWEPIKHLSKEDCYEFFNLLFFNDTKYIDKIFSELSNNKIGKYYKEINGKFPNELERILPYYFVLQNKLEKSRKYEITEEFFHDLQNLSLDDIKNKYDLCKRIIKNDEALNMFVLKYILEIPEKEYNEICKKLSSFNTYFSKSNLAECSFDIFSEFAPLPGLGIAFKIGKIFVEDIRRNMS